MSSRQTGVFVPASPAQRAKVEGRRCIVCAVLGIGNRGPRSMVQPAHGLPRTWWGCDDRDCVFWLCQEHHEPFDGRAGDSYFMFMPYLFSRAARKRLLAGRAPTVESLGDFDEVMAHVPHTFRGLYRRIDPRYRVEILHMHEEIELRLPNGEWPFWRSEFPHVASLQLPWARPRSRLTAHMVLVTVLMYGSGVLVKRNIDHYAEKHPDDPNGLYWFTYLRDHPEVRNKKNLPWILENNPRVRRAFAKHRPDQSDWHLVHPLHRRF